MTKRLCILTTTLAAVSAVALAQAPAAQPAPAPVPENPISDSQKRVYTMLSSVLIAAAEKMPEENYAFKPSPDVRSFGQLVGHLADSQYYFCASATGETKPATDAEKTKTKKADLIAALKEAVAYCGPAYAGMTDAKGAQMTKMMNFDFARMTVLAANFAHMYEHYGNMSTYMRIKGVVPPTSEKKEGQPQPQH